MARDGPRVRWLIPRFPARPQSDFVDLFRPDLAGCCQPLLEDGPSLPVGTHPSPDTGRLEVRKGLLERVDHVVVRTETARIDAVVITAARIFVFEFKLQGTAEDALQQIHQRRYHEKYTADGRELLLVGAAFDPETRNLERWLVERM